MPTTLSALNPEVVDHVPEQRLKLVQWASAGNVDDDIAVTLNFNQATAGPLPDRFRIETFACYAHTIDVLSTTLHPEQSVGVELVRTVDSRTISFFNMPIRQYQIDVTDGRFGGSQAVPFGPYLLQRDKYTGLTVYIPHLDEDTTATWDFTFFMTVRDYEK